ncbi:hypothetical protein BGW36DRAFT_397529 [Talaromyces proteolyticus]|uniref:Uncharacterized protein n=1 Tax=Talaromyces proteolyticus TaxID=1131652 RepID=A0AAD4KTI3_9EURO|nr:uncharacterized protein BGW36DRAFT_397529 [Talaromyces proteolyticus]KAH8697932.1 hypothetical protein BGW36DRAFT_397529 [Talaromyces proteolyticus]
MSVLSKLITTILVALLYSFNIGRDSDRDGLAIAALFASQNVIIFGCDLDISAGKNIKAQTLSQVPDAGITVMETNPTSSQFMDVFVNACMSKPEDPGNMSKNTWDNQTDVNSKSLYLASHFVLPIIVKQANGGNMYRLADKYTPDNYERFQQKRKTQAPIKRMGTASDISRTILFLASKEAEYITGAKILVDGAFTCSTGVV